jgi:ribosomal protein S18 acetylase RimI-like enzyme
VDLRPKLGQPGVRSVLALLAPRGHPGEVDRIADRYGRPGASLLGLVVEPSWETEDVLPGTPVACIGLEPRGQDEAEITALAVLPDWRRQGLARSLVFRACEELRLGAVEAEAGVEAVDFFRASGFAVEAVGGRRPGTERFRCRLELPPR